MSPKEHWKVIFKLWDLCRINVSAKGVTITIIFYFWEGSVCLFPTKTVALASLLEMQNLLTLDLLNQNNQILHFNKIPRWFVIAFNIEKHSSQLVWYYYPVTVAFFLSQTMLSGSFLRAFALAIPDCLLPKFLMALFCHSDFSSSSIPSESLRVLTPRELHYPVRFSHSAYSPNYRAHIYLFSCLLSVSSHWNIKLHKCRNALPVWFTVLFLSPWDTPAR